MFTLHRGDKNEEAKGGSLLIYLFITYFVKCTHLSTCSYLKLVMIYILNFLIVEKILSNNRSVYLIVKPVYNLMPI